MSADKVFADAALDWGLGKYFEAGKAVAHVVVDQILDGLRDPRVLHETRGYEAKA